MNDTTASQVLPATRSPIEQLEDALGCSLATCASRAQALVAGGLPPGRPGTRRSYSSALAAGVDGRLAHLELELAQLRDAQKRALAAAPRYAVAAPERDAARLEAQADALEQRIATVATLQPLVRRHELRERLSDAESEEADLRVQISEHRRHEGDPIPSSICGEFGDGVHSFGTPRPPRKPTWQDADRDLRDALQRVQGNVVNAEVALDAWAAAHPELEAALHHG
jgi:hypothetical protein